MNRNSLASLTIRTTIEKLKFFMGNLIDIYDLRYWGNPTTFYPSTSPPNVDFFPIFDVPQFEYVYRKGGLSFDYPESPCILHWVWTAPKTGKRLVWGEVDTLLAVTKGDDNPIPIDIAIDALQHQPPGIDIQYLLLFIDENKPKARAGMEAVEIGENRTSIKFLDGYMPLQTLRGLQPDESTGKAREPIGDTFREFVEWFIFRLNEADLVVVLDAYQQDKLTKKDTLPPVDDPTNQRILEWVRNDPSLTDTEIGQRLQISRQAANARRGKLKAMGYTVR